MNYIHITFQLVDYSLKQKCLWSLIKKCCIPLVYIIMIIHFSLLQVQTFATFYQLFTFAIYSNFSVLIERLHDSVSIFQTQNVDSLHSTEPGVLCVVIDNFNLSVNYLHINVLYNINTRILLKYQYLYVLVFYDIKVFN